MNPIEILARIYSIMADASSDDLTKTAHFIRHQRDLSMALRALANERAKHDSASVKKKGSHPVSSPEVQLPMAHEPVSGGSYRELDQIERTIFDPRVFRDNFELAKHLNSQHLGGRFHPRDGRNRMRQKFRKLMLALSASERQRIIDDLAMTLSKTQTEGWFDAIRSPRR